MRFITFEGIDGTGKSTLAKRLHEHLPGSYLTYAPFNTPLGERLKPLLTQVQMTPLAEFYLYIADRHEQTHNLPLHTQTVISDRYMDSTYAYQYTIQEDLLCTAISRFPTPTLTFLLTLDPPTALKRKQDQGQPESFTPEQLNTIQQRYLKLAQHDPRFVILDASQPLDTLFQRILQCLK